MKDDVIVNKIETIKRCVSRIKEEYVGFEDVFYSNFTKQDSIILNLERLAQAAIDLSAHIIRVKKLGVPQTSRDIFTILAESGVITKETNESMCAMVGFRNISVHDYQSLNLDIVVSVVTKNLIDFETFAEEIVRY